MSVVTIERSHLQRFDAAEPDRGLDELLAGLWEELTSGRVVRCPICAGEMRPQRSGIHEDPHDGIHHDPHGGRCEECGTRLT